MEPRDRAAQALTERFRLVAVCAALTALAFLQAPGRVVGDTKVDLVVDPGAWLSRAVSIWDPDGQLGQVQNQAYGYLFPMGPFFWVGDVLQLDPWVVQRLWWALLWCVACCGVVRLCRELGIGTPGVRLLAGVLFALSPRFLSVIGPSSIEMWPTALAPWVLVPLVIGLSRGRAWRQAGLSALAVGCVGGVNAVATSAVLPLAVLWLLLAPRGPRRRALLLWWPPLVLVAVLWWLVPLLLLGQYSPPFLDYIESSTVTSSTATVLDALRGTTNWVPRVSWQGVAGREILTTPVIVGQVLVLVAIGAVGLVRRDLPHRRFLVTGLAAGLVLMTIGHTGTVSGWFAPELQIALDGSLAPLRNAHKFDVVARLPMVLGLAHAVTVWLGADRERTFADVRLWTARLAVGSAVLAVTLPAWAGHVAPRGSWDAVPDYWSQTTTWLADHDSPAALVLPASSFADQIWGSTGDEVVQPLATTPWITRSVVPLTPPGTIRMLDAVTDQASSGSPTGLAATLRRAGIRHVVVRFDLADRVDPSRAELIDHTLTSTPGLVEVASFGPDLGSDPSTEIDGQRFFVSGGWQTEQPAVIVFEVQDAPTPFTPVDTAPVVVGDAGTLAALDTLGVLPPGSTFLAGDRPESSTGPWVLTDGQRRSEVDFSAVDRQRSAALGPGEPYRFDRGTHDYAADDTSASVVELEGARGLTASSSRSDAGVGGGSRPSAGPWSAFDGDPRSAWQSRTDTGWIRLQLDEPTDLGVVTIRTGQPPGATEELTVHTQDGPRTVQAIGDAAVEVEVGRVDRIEVAGARVPLGRFQIAEISSPALTVSRPLVLPRAEGPVSTVVLGLDHGVRPGCLDVELIARCRVDQEEPGEDAWSIDRIVALPADDVFTLDVRASPVGGPALDEVLQQGQPMQLRSSSTLSNDPATTVSLTLDGSAATGWIADPEDLDPTVTLSWSSPQVLTELTLRTDESLPASSVARIAVVSDTGERATARGRNGVFELSEPVSGESFRVVLVSAEDVRDNPRDGTLPVLPVGVSELSVEGAPASEVVVDRRTLALPCGTGPTVTIDGAATTTSVFTTPQDLVTGSTSELVACEAPDIELAAGEHRITSRASGLFDAGIVVLHADSVPLAAPGTSDLVVVPTGHNTNDAWQGTVDGRAVPAVRVDGWQQGYVVPAREASALQERFAPAAAYRAVLLGGGVLAVLLAAVVLASRRRERDAAPVTDHSRASRWASSPVMMGGAVLTAGLLGGTPGALAAAGALALLHVLHPRSAGAARVLAPAAVVALTGTAAVATLLGDGAPPALAQWCALGVVVVVLASASVPAAMPDAGERRRTRRIPGRSTR